MHRKPHWCSLNLPLVNRAQNKLSEENEMGKNKKDETFPISEANRLLSPSLADVCRRLLLFDGANLNILLVPWDCCLCLSEYTERGPVPHPLAPDDDIQANL